MCRNAVFKGVLKKKTAVEVWLLFLFPFVWRWHTGRFVLIKTERKKAFSEQMKKRNMAE